MRLNLMIEKGENEMSNNNSLVPVSENIFSKIKRFFSNLFGRESINDSSIMNMPQDTKENKLEIKNSIFMENIKIEETEEQKLLKLQKMIHEKSITENDLSSDDTEKLRKLYRSQINELRNSIIEKQNKLMKIKYHQRRKAHATANK